MVLYIMRHAEAVEASDVVPDHCRYLTEKGRAAAEKTCSELVKLGRKPRRTITSPLTRAVQTAEISARYACRRNEVVATVLLLPDGDVTELATYVRGHGDAKRVMLVGHEPQLGQLVATLLGRKDFAVTLKKGSCVTLELKPGKDGDAEFLWYLVPGRKRNTSLKKSFPAV